MSLVSHMQNNKIQIRKNEHDTVACGSVRTLYNILENIIISAPTLISRPKGVESGLNPDQNFKKTRPNPDPILPFSRTGYSKTGLIRTLGPFYRFKGTFLLRITKSTHTKMWHFRHSFHNIMKNPDFSAKSGPNLDQFAQKSLEIWT